MIATDATGSRPSVVFGQTFCSEKIRFLPSIQDDIDPDRDLTRPTNMSTTMNLTNISLSDDSDISMRMLKKRKLNKSKKKHFTEEDFNVTVGVSKGERWKRFFVIEGGRYLKII